MRRHVTLNLTFNTDCLKEWKTRQALNKQLDNNKENMAAHSGIQAALEALSVKHDTEVILINLYVTLYHTQCHTVLCFCVDAFRLLAVTAVCLLWNGIMHYLQRPRVVHA